jgi:hypothetical protein
MTRSSYKLLNVSSVAEREGKTTVCFRNGRCGILFANDPNYSWAVQYLNKSRETGWLVGVLFEDENRIASVAVPDRNIVIGYQPNKEDSVTLDVWFEGESGPMTLRTDNPDSARLVGVIEQAIKTREWIWYVAKGTEIVDLILLSADEDVALCQSIQGR